MTRFIKIITVSQGLVTGVTASKINLATDVVGSLPNSAGGAGPDAVKMWKPLLDEHGFPVTDENGDPTMGYCPA